METSDGGSKAPQITSSSITLRSVKIQPGLKHSRPRRCQSGETLVEQSHRASDGDQQGAVVAKKAATLLTQSSLEAEGFETPQFAPRFVKVLKSRIVTEGQDLVLSCTVHGDPRPEISWLLNDQPIQFARSTYEDQIAQLTVQDALPEDRGVYTCVAQNSCGSSSCKATVTVTDCYNVSIYTFSDVG
ncbi:unnamed protein product [Ranitomeya imitator]|uniref:Ig-like domain-containing protein n=1 Tax=Ranitomeya imitator TaxID=111125 RepID=A0ABN9LJ55_9NEOB|nr:unnamed protein product [Ranitomeya imitator]